MLNAITGLDDHLLPRLEEAIERADRIRLIVGFVMESGVKLILPTLQQAARRGVPIEILTGQYLSITQPSALYFLYNKLGNSIDIRLYNGGIEAFHPKAYILDHGDEAEVFVGSSNLSRSALTTGIEWNCRFLRSEHPSEYSKFSDTFDELFKKYARAATPEVLKEYALTWKKPKLIRDVETQMVQTDKPEPRDAQIEALYYLKQARDEGASKGVVVAATGVGKTHLAAFDSLEYNRVLFLAHRQQILEQAYKAFSSVRPESQFGFYVGEQKDEGADICFSTVQTLSRDEHLEIFPKGYFDYIVVDEFHHAAADSYRKVIAHFEPRFLLGLTATPFRMDNKDIFSLCDDNVVYEISLKQSIERGLLVPFYYYAIYDPTNYDDVRIANGSYVIEDLEKQLSHAERADLVLEHYRKLAGEQCLAFCVSIKHAEYMAEYFSAHGISSATVHSGEPGNGHALERNNAIRALEEGQINVIFAVDMFNEGVDVPSLDTVMFLRPTESYVIFLQQLGRGLRKYPGKHHLTVIDFIGNYKRAHYVPLLLAGDNPWTHESSRYRRLEDYEFPEDCTVNFDLRIIDLFDELAERDPLPVRMKDTYWRIKKSVGRRPNRVDIYEGSDIPMREYLKNGWLRFLESVDELESEESEWIDTPAEAFLAEIEQTRMTKAYKLPTIGAFLREGDIMGQAKLNEIGESMMRFYVDHPLHQKDFSDKSNRKWHQWTADDFSELARKNPVRFLSQGQFFHYDEINRVMYIDPQVQPYLSPLLAKHVQDILSYRRIDYFRRRFKGN